MERDDDAPGPMTDVVLVGPETEAGGNAVLRHREDRLEIGEMRAVREGQPMGSGELVRLQKRPEHARLVDVEVRFSVQPSPVAPEPRSGPPQVATDAYRAGWESIFGGDGEGGLN